MNGPVDRADVLIVGAGISGGVVGKHLAERGFSVVVLEQGDWVSQGDFMGTTPEYELAPYQKWSADPNDRKLDSDYPVDLSDSEGPILHMYNAVGGSSVLYTAVWPRPVPSDFRVRSLDGVADDWPISYQDLLPHFEATDDEFGASGLGGNPAYPASPGPKLPPLPMASTGRKAAEGMNALGWHWWPGHNAIPSLAHGEQAQCVRYGVCGSGCPAGAKGSTDVTHWPAAIRAGAKLITGARVREISVDESGRASGAIYIDRDGMEHFQPASVVILASNGVGTSRLMLMSRSDRFPDGIANSSGLVGKRLMLHPCATVAGVFDDEFDELGPSGQKIGSMEFYDTNLDRGFVRGAYWTLYDGVGPLFSAVRNMLGEGIDPASLWGTNFIPSIRETARHTVMWGIIAEDLPEETNFVSLDPELTDSDGLPAPKITYKRSENTSKMIDFNVDRATEALMAAGANRTFVVGRNAPPGHLLGTARMGDDPATSVVNRYGQAHDVPNLYVVDGSVFVTAPAVNPTSTIATIAKWVAVNLVENRRNQEVSS